MPRFTIICPTYNNGATVRHAIESVQRQTLADVELFVVGDGAPPSSRALVEALAAKDDRIRYFENPKGESHGERHRHRALGEGTGEYIAYIGDDDLWLPQHLATVVGPLADHDFVHTAHADVVAAEDWRVGAVDLNDAHIRRRMQKELFNFFGPTAVAHRRDAYERLPYGWRPYAAGMWGDLHMWRQWLAEDWVRYRSLSEVTVLHLGVNHRNREDVEGRCGEMRFWLQRMSEPGFSDYVARMQREDWLKKISRSHHPGHPIMAFLRRCASKLREQ